MKYNVDTKYNSPICFKKNRRPVLEYIYFDYAHLRRNPFNPQTNISFTLVCKQAVALIEEKGT